MAIKMRVVRFGCFIILSSIVFGLSCTTISGDAPEVQGTIYQQREFVDYATRSCVNLIDHNRVIIGANIARDGSVVEEPFLESVVTCLLPVCLGNYWFQKVLYLQACCMRKGEYGFFADVVAFYDKNKICLCVEQCEESPVLIPEKAYYARIQYRQSDQQLFASITNRTVLNLYSEYDRKRLVADPFHHYLTVTNSPGSISHFLRTGCDYFDRGFGYGSLHTAFNTNCTPAESYDNHYEGLKSQIDCSAFVELALTGVRYMNSRYYRGSDAVNIPEANSFVFDQFTEYNYNMIQFPEECGADNGRLYANKIAKYFYDRGYLYEIEDNFANVQTGDLLFWGSGGVETRFFYGIGHVAICSDSWLKKEGGKGVRVMENAYEKVIEYSESIRYGARPNLPFMDYLEDCNELVDKVSITSGSCLLNAGEITLVSNVILHEDLQLRELYTLIMKCKVPDGITVICKNRVDKIALGSDDIEELYPKNGIITKHFGIRQRMLGNTPDIIGIYLFSPTTTTCEFEIEAVSLKKGYRMEDSI